MKLTHTGNDGLTGFLVGLDAEGGVFSGKALQSVGHLLLVTLGEGFHSHGNHGIREGRGLERVVKVVGSEGVTRGSVLQTHDSGDITGVHSVHVGVNIGLNLEETAHALTLAGTGIVHGVALADNAGVHADEHQRTHELVGPELECKSDGLVVIGGVDFLHLEGLVAVFVETVGDGGGHSGLLGLQRGGQVVHNSVQKTLHTLVLESGTTGDGYELVSNGGATDSSLERLSIDGLLHKEEFGELVVHISHTALQLLESHLSLFLQLGGNLRHLDGGAQLVGGVVHDGLLVHHVNLTGESVLRTDGDKHGGSIGAELSADVGQHILEVGTDTVHLVHEAQTGHVVLGGLAPHRLRLGLHTGNTAEHHDSAVEHAQGALHLCGEVHVPGGINNVELEVLVLEDLVAALSGELFPVGRNGGGGNGNTALLFLLHPVGGGRAIVRLTELMDHAGVEQDTFRKRGFATVNVSGNTEVTVALQRGLAVGAAYISHNKVI